jgi:hypothetical protein
MTRIRGDHGSFAVVCDGSCSSALALSPSASLTQSFPCVTPSACASVLFYLFGPLCLIVWVFVFESFILSFILSFIEKVIKDGASDQLPSLEQYHASTIPLRTKAERQSSVATV